MRGALLCAIVLGAVTEVLQPIYIWYILYVLLHNAEQLKCLNQQHHRPARSRGLQGSQFQSWVLVPECDMFNITE